MTKKELLKAIKSCNQVFACTRLTDNDMFDLQVTKVDLIWKVNQCDTETWTEDHFNAWIDKNNNLRLG
jgi:hypothetical protein